MKFLGKLYSNTAIIVLGMILFYIFFELAGSTYVYFFRSDDSYHPANLLDLSPYIMFTNKSNLSREGLNTNDLGFRAEKDFDEYLTYYPKNRIVVLGGSLAFGNHASNEENTFQKKLELYLSEHLDDVEVLNLAVSGGNSLHELLAYRLYGQRLKPKLVINLSGYNDVTSDKGMNYPLHWDTLLSYWHGKNNIFQFVWFYFRYSKLTRFLIPKVVKTNQNPDPPIMDYDMMEEWISTNMSILDDLLDRQEIEHMFLLQPYLKSSQGLGTVYEEIYNRFDLIFEGFKSERNLHYINLQDQADFQRAELYYDSAHLFDEGFDIIAKQVSDYIITKEILKDN